MKKYLILLWSFIFVYQTNSQVVINEISSVNYDIIIDEDFDRPDWIELYNTGSTPVNLKGCKIFDKDYYDNACVFPEVVINGKSKLLVYASGKNFHNSGKFAMEASGEGIFQFARNDSYRFDYIELSGDFEFSVRVHSLTNVHVFGSTGVIVREDLTNIHKFLGVLSQRADRRYNEFIYREDTTFNYRYPKNINSGIELIYPDIVLSVKRLGDSITAGIYDIEGYCLKTFTKVWEFPEKVYVGLALSSTKQDMMGKATFSTLKINGQSRSFGELTGMDFDLDLPGKAYSSDELHTNFSLSSDGEQLILWDASGNVADSKDFPSMYVDMSFGRFPDGTNNWTFFQPPTPKESNKNNKTAILKQPKFSLNPGFYNTAQITKIYSSDINSKIYYTLNGSEPTQDNKLYVGEDIFINQTTVLKARVYQDGYINSQIETATYFLNENNVGMPVVSLSTNPQYFFDENIGIFHRYFDEFEYPCTFEYFDSLNNRVYKNRVGMKIHGNSSVLFPQKSMRFHTRSIYGENDFNFPFFGPDKPDSFDKLILRNGGQDWSLAFLRNSYIHRVSFGIKNLVSTHSKPALVFLNGEFWGMFNILERADDDLLSSRFKVNDTSFSLLEQNLRILKGAVNSYRVFLDSLNIIDITSNSIYNFYKNHIDIDNFIKYTTLSLYSNNDDWPTNNFKIWKSTELDNKWRWMVHDMDLCLAGSSRSAYTANHLKKVLSWVDEDPNFYHIGYILASGFKDELFKNRFLNTNCDLLNSTFLQSNMNKILDSILYDMLPGIPLQKARWEGSVVDFDNQIELIKEFIEKRPAYYREQLREYFELSGISKIDLSSDIDKACTFSVNSLENLNNLWQGYYLNDIPIEIVVHPNHGFKFVNWKIGENNFVFGDTLRLTLSDSTDIKAIFEESVEPRPGMAVINEIMYKSADNKDSDDWIEIHNPGDLEINISGWVLKDDKNSRNFALPLGTKLLKGDYLVLCENRNKFGKIYPNTHNVIGEFDFGFGTDDMVRIFDNTGKLQDSVRYTNKSPWYPEADGMGPSLELIDAFWDNSIASSWRVSTVQGGSPGRSNTVTDISDNILKSYMKIYPNPLSDISNIEFELEYAGNIEVTVTDLFGNKVRRLIQGSYDSGNYSTYWDGKDNDGIKLPGGMYFIIIQTEKGIIREKMILE